MGGWAGVLVDDEVLRVAIIASSLVLVVAWIVSSLIFRVSGTWERVATPDEGLERKTERMELAQLGPFVRGRHTHPGGHQEYSGWIFGRTMRLTRRDHGLVALEQAGFPPAIAEKLDGEVMGRLTLKLKGEVLEGSFHPIKVNYTHQPPRVTELVTQPPVARVYRRVAPTAAPAEVSA